MIASGLGMGSCLLPLSVLGPHLVKTPAGPVFWNLRRLWWLLRPYQVGHFGSQVESVSRYLEWAERGWCSEGPQEEGKLSSPLGMGTEEGEARADGLLKAGGKDWETGVGRQEGE